MRIAALARVAVAAAVSADSPDAQYLQGMRERRWFELGEFYAGEGLGTAQPGSAAQADWTLELVRTLALHAASSPPEARDPLWAKARSVAGDFLRHSPSSPRALLVRVQ